MKPTQEQFETERGRLPVSPHNCERCGAGDHPTEDCV